MTNQPNNRLEGVILSFFPERGYGFLRNLSGMGEYFYNVTRSPELDQQAIRVGLMVEFSVRSLPNGREEAVNVRKLDGA
jgi:cold shock CspA family protein